MHFSHTLTFPPLTFPSIRATLSYTRDFIMANATVKAIIVYAFENPQKTVAETAEALDLHVSMVRYIRNSDAFKDALDREVKKRSKGTVKPLVPNVKQQLNQLATSSLEELQHRLDSDPETFTVRTLREIAEAAVKMHGNSSGAKAASLTAVHLHVSVAGLEKSQQLLRTINTQNTEEPLAIGHDDG